MPGQVSEPVDLLADERRVNGHQPFPLRIESQLIGDVEDVDSRNQAMVVAADLFPAYLDVGPHPEQPFPVLFLAPQHVSPSLSDGVTQSQPPPPLSFPFTPGEHAVCQKKT